MYIDLLLILNFCFDFLILLCVSIVLKRNVSFKKIALGSFFGSFTIIILFININSFSLFLFKIFLSLIMIFITFGIKDFKYNFNNFFCRVHGRGQLQPRCRTHLRQKSRPHPGHGSAGTRRWAAHPE